MLVRQPTTIARDAALTFNGHAGWAATCTNEDYIRRMGIRRMGMDSLYKQEIVAGNLSGFMARGALLLL